MGKAKPIWAAVVLSVLLLVAACGPPAAGPTLAPTSAPTPAATPPKPSGAATTAPLPSPTPTATREPGTEDLSDEEIAALLTLEQVDDYPLYTMHYYGSYETRGFSGARLPAAPWTCSLFAVWGNTDDVLFGRNFDWEYSPALLLFTYPPEGYASVSVVDIAYLGFDGADAHGLTDLPLDERRALLQAPSWPFDGMNEHGLAVGMAAVPASEMPPNAGRPTVDSLLLMRLILENARTVDEAVTLFREYDVSWAGGPPLHYLIADRSGRAVLVEFYEGEMLVLPSQNPWHMATNHLRSATSDTESSGCWRYDLLSREIERAGGRLTVGEVLALLADVSQPGTQWSIVYGLNSGEVNVAMGRDYDTIHTLHLSPTVR